MRDRGYFSTMEGADLQLFNREISETMLRNSAGGVTRWRYCQPHVPPTFDQNIQASGIAMVSL